MQLLPRNAPEEASDWSRTSFPGNKPISITSSIFDLEFPKLENFSIIFNPDNFSNTSNFWMPSPPPPDVKEEADSPIEPKLNRNFWVLIMAVSLLYASVLPFMSISLLLFSKRNSSHPQLMLALPDAISILFIPFLQRLEFTRRIDVVKFLAVCGIAIVCIHSTLLFTVSWDITCMLLLRIFYSSFSSAFWSGCRLFCSEKQISFAFRIATSLINATLVAVPLIVASIDFDFIGYLFAGLSGFGAFILFVLTCTLDREVELYTGLDVGFLRASGFFEPRSLRQSAYYSEDGYGTL